MNREYLTMWERQVRKGLVEFVLLSLLASERLYPPEIVDRTGLLGVRLPAGTVYPVLSRLRKEGLVDVVTEPSVAGPPRKYYRTSPTGLDLLKSMRTVIGDLAPVLGTLLRHRGEEMQCA